MENWTTFAERGSISGLSLTVEPFHDGKGRDSIWSRTNRPVLKFSRLLNVRREETQQAEHYLNVWHVIFLLLFCNIWYFLYEVKPLMEKRLTKFLFFYLQLTHHWVCSRNTAEAKALKALSFLKQTLKIFYRKPHCNPSTFKSLFYDFLDLQQGKQQPCCSAGRRPPEREPLSTNHGLAPRSSHCWKVSYGTALFAGGEHKKDSHKRQETENGR